MLLRIIFRTFFFYFVVALAYRVMGKRELGELSIFDFVISILISQIIAIGIENYKSPLLYVFIPIVILVILQILLAYLALKSQKLRNTFDGSESVIINNGKLNFKEMIKQRYNLNDLLVQLREKSIKTIEEVDYAILETNGKLSIFSKKEKNSIFPLPIILDGKIETNNLKIINKNISWINKVLKNKNVSLNDIFYAFYDKNELYILKKEDTNISS